jgi:hypothetical protein
MDGHTHASPESLGGKQAFTARTSIDETFGHEGNVGLSENYVTISKSDDLIWFIIISA